MNENSCEKLLFNGSRAVDFGGGLRGGVVTITPKQCEWILDHAHVPNNRRMKPSAIARYSADLICGRWPIHHLGIAFNEKGLLCDGQNRLRACVRSGQSITTMVTFGISQDAMDVIDQGVRRSPRDILSMRGREFSHQVIGAMRMMVCPTNPQTLTGPQMVKASEVLWEPMKFLVDEFPTHINRITVSGCLAAIGVRYYHEDVDRLREFCTALKDGVVDNRSSDSAAILFLRWLLGTTGSGKTGRYECYCRGQNAIDAFCDYRGVQKLYRRDVAVKSIPEGLRKNILGVQEYDND